MCFAYTNPLSAIARRLTPISRGPGELVVMKSSVGYERALAATLFVRGGDHAVFALWVIARQPGWTDVFQAGSIYALIDGTLGLVAALLLVRGAPPGSPPFLPALTFADGVGRVVAGIALRTLPGIPYLPMLFVPFLGGLGACAVGLGISAIVAWRIARRRAGQTRSISAVALFDPLAIAAFTAFGVAYVLLVDPPATAAALRTIATATSAALALVFAAASFGALTRLTPRQTAGPGRAAKQVSVPLTHS